MIFYYFNFQINNINNETNGNSDENITLYDFITIYNKHLTKLTNFDLPLIVDVGVVLTVGDGIVKATGLSSVKAGELVYFPQANDMQGMAINLEFNTVGIVLFGNHRL